MFCLWGCILLSTVLKKWEILEVAVAPLATLFLVVGTRWRFERNKLASQKKLVLRVVFYISSLNR